MHIFSPSTSEFPVEAEAADDDDDLDVGSQAPMLEGAWNRTEFLKQGWMLHLKDNGAELGDADYPQGSPLEPAAALINVPNNMSANRTIHIGTADAIPWNPLSGRVVKFVRRGVTGNMRSHTFKRASDGATLATMNATLTFASVTLWYGTDAEGFTRWQVIDASGDVFVTG